MTERDEKVRVRLSHDEAPAPGTESLEQTFPDEGGLNVTLERELREAICDEDWTIREDAARKIGDYGQRARRLLKDLLHALLNDVREEVKKEALWSVYRIEPKCLTGAGLSDIIHAMDHRKPSSMGSTPPERQEIVSATDESSDASIRSVQSAMGRIRTLSDRSDAHIKETLMALRDELFGIRVLLAREIAVVFNRFEGRRYSLDESKQVASLMDYIASSLGLLFEIKGKPGEPTRLASLRCGVAGRDRAPSFQYECREGGRQVIRHSSRALEHVNLVPAPPDSRRRRLIG